MNDEELRAFLDSATVGDTDEKPEPEVEAPRPAPAEPTASEAQSAPRRGVPSFEELMKMPAAPAAAPVAQQPVAQPAQPPVQAPPVAQQPVAQQPAATPQPAAAQSQAPQVAADQEELVPLILPGFSPEPRQRQDLPPVFRTEPAAAQPQAAPAQAHDDPAPTQPFDVLSDQAAAAAAPAAVTPAAAPTAPTFPVAAAPRQAATKPTETAAPATDNPFALLSEDLVSAEPEIEYGDEYEPIAVTGGESRSRKALPWIIVGGGAIIALVASIFVINGVRANDSTEPVAPPTTTTEPAPTPEPSTKPEQPEETKPVDPTTAPVVDPGSTWTLRIDQWDMTVEVSEKLGGSTPYTLIDGNTQAMFDSLPVTSGISDACAVAKAEGAWGLKKNDDGKLEVVRPEPRCSNPADAAVYDTIWGVLDYMAKSAKAA
ncbi:hypothetical protein QBL02_01920 [Leucobacter sp. UT-8R-CII-1-4]|uniref:hypothetical protein n=1 Tax=Leucobacter sp. UT-8R-CII-1-4 TaxID=3040075 RepID=UPI0024A85E1A|nr:hypothetical protein [Leucobacter sp. UT-8R-CII-1-4]MDI6022299.1 hypothetical protein [Leucobacter sp. UT-8R-CII-1-4]